jgi:hypothetical protein
MDDETHEVWRAGELIRAGADPRHVHLFDAASGERIGDG